METDVQTKTNTNSDTLSRVAISTDQLFLLKDDGNHQRLLEGTDNKAFILEGDVPSVYALIDICYNARDTRIPTLITFECGRQVLFR